jgi:hypothetical protein
MPSDARPDAGLFDSPALEILRRAAGDLSFLLVRGYSMAASLKLVGDRYQLRRPQRQALLRSLSLHPTAASRMKNRIFLTSARDSSLVVDGYNVLITVETALGGGVLIRCSDGCVRDIRGVGARYRPTASTDEAIELIGDLVTAAGPSRAEWVFDAPVSGSGELAGRVRERSNQMGWPFHAVTAGSADGHLMGSDGIVCSGDAAILDRAGRWIDLAGEIIATRLPEADILSFVPVAGE